MGAVRSGRGTRGRTHGQPTRRLYFSRYHCRAKYSGTARASATSVSVVDLQEREPVGRGRLACGAAVVRGDHVANPAWIALVSADFDQRARNRANHIVEEAIAFDVNMKE